MIRISILSISLCFYFYGQSQIVEDIKKNSENHNKNSGSRSSGKSQSGSNSGNNKSNQNSGSSSGYSNSNSSEIDPSCLFDACSGIFNILSLIDFHDYSSDEQKESTRSAPKTEPNQSVVVPDSLPNALPPEKIPNAEVPINGSNYNEKRGNGETEINIPFEKISFSLRGSFYPSNFHIWVPEIMGGKKAFSFALRLMSLREQRLDKIDNYTTFDFQPFQISFVNKRNVLFKIGVGGMAETFSEMIYIEMTSNIKWRINSKFDIGLEGRFASHKAISIRNEASFQANYSIWQKNNKQFFVGLNGMLSRYYEKTDVNVVSFQSGFRF